MNRLALPARRFPPARYLLVPAACLFGLSSVLASPYDEKRAAAVKRCEAIDPAASQSGLVFNPDGYRSYYLRSECFQRTAIEFRDDSLCAQVKERRSLFFSSWGYSERRCRELVAEAAARDRQALEAMKELYTKGGMRLRDFRVERNGNGRDFDIIPLFTGDYAHGYALRFEIVQPDAATPTLLHANGYFVDQGSNLRIYLPQADVRQRMTEFTLDRPYSVRATATLDVGTGTASGNWSDAFIERVFPPQERSHSITKEVRF